MTALVVLEAVVIALLVVLVAGLLRSHAEILRQLHELGVGERPDGAGIGVPTPRRRPSRGEVTVEAVTGATPTGGSASVPLTGTRGLILLAFLSSGCTTCRPFWGATPATGDLAHPDVRTVIVTRGVEEESPGAVRNLAGAETTVVMSTEAWEAFRTPASPYFVLVDGASGSVVGEGTGASWPQVGDLVAQAAIDSQPAHQSRGVGRFSTADRLRDTDEELRRSGIEPGDPSLYRAPTDGEPR